MTDQGGVAKAGQRTKHWPPKDPPMFWVSFATFLVTFATLGAVLIYVYYTRLQVDATNIGNYITNRPYVMWVAYLPVRIEQKKWAISVQIENFGKTPAIELKTRMCDPIIRDNPEQPSLKCTEAYTPNPNNSTVLGPTQRKTWGGTLVDDDTFNATGNATGSGKKFLYVLGLLTYRDGLNPEKQHETRFCHRIEYKREFVAPPAGGSTAPHPTPETALQPTPETAPTHAQSVTSTGGRVLESFTTIGCTDPAWTCIDDDCPPLPRP
jgi:hypothetical protein